MKFDLFFVYLICGTILFPASCNPDNKKHNPGLTPNVVASLDGKSLTYSLKFRKQSLELDNYFKSIYLENIFSGAVIIAKQGVPIYRKAYGLANRSRHTPVDCDYAFQLGSVSKQFTAISVLILEQEGKLNVNDSVQKYFPAFPYKNITIRTLLTHLSGLPNYIYFIDQMPVDKYTLLTNQKMMEIMCDSIPEKYYPAKQSFHYCNTNYAVLAAIVEKISGQSFEEFVHKEIFEPLGMTHSFFYSEITKYKNQNIATGYLSPGYEAGFFYLNGITGDKGIFSTVDDMLKWDFALYSDKILKREFTQEAFKPQTKTRRHNIFYGYGWKMYTLEDSTKVLFHSGWWQGYQSVIMRIPKDSTTVIILKNKKTAHPVNQSIVLDILYPGNHFFKVKPKETEHMEESEEQEGTGN